MFFRCLLTPVSLLPVWSQSWRTRWPWAAALWTARILTLPSKTCPACLSAPRRAATWRWSPPCPESGRTLRSARHRSTRPPYAEASNSLDLLQCWYSCFFNISLFQWSIPRDLPLHRQYHKEKIRFVARSCEPITCRKVRRLNRERCSSTMRKHLKEVTESNKSKHAVSKDIMRIIETKNFKIVIWVIVPS